MEIFQYLNETAYPTFEQQILFLGLLVTSFGNDATDMPISSVSHITSLMQVKLCSTFAYKFQKFSVSSILMLLCIIPIEENVNQEVDINSKYEPVEV